MSSPRSVVTGAASGGASAAILSSGQKVIGIAVEGVGVRIAGSLGFGRRFRRGEKMRALKLVQHMKTNADRMSDTVIEKIRRSDRCSELLQKVPAEEQKRSGVEIYRDLTNWLATEADSSIEERYIALGMRRAEQGVPFSHLYWAVCIAHEHLWEYMQQECLLDEPVEFWGGVGLLRSLTQFFDRALYFTLLGYQRAGKGELAGASAA